MKENKAGNCGTLTLAELEVKIRQLREEIFNLRFRNSVKQLDNPLKLREMRRGHRPHRDGPGRAPQGHPPVAGQAKE